MNFKYKGKEKSRKLLPDGFLTGLRKLLNRKIRPSVAYALIFALTLSGVVTVAQQASASGESYLATAIEIYSKAIGGGEEIDENMTTVTDEQVNEVIAAYYAGNISPSELLKFFRGFGIPVGPFSFDAEELEEEDGELMKDIYEESLINRYVSEILEAYENTDKNLLLAWHQEDLTERDIRELEELEKASPSELSIKKEETENGKVSVEAEAETAAETEVAVSVLAAESAEGPAAETGSESTEGAGTETEAGGESSAAAAEEAAKTADEGTRAEEEPAVSILSVGEATAESASVSTGEAQEEVFPESTGETESRESDRAETAGETEGSGEANGVPESAETVETAESSAENAEAPGAPEPSVPDSLAAMVAGLLGQKEEKKEPLTEEKAAEIEQIARGIVEKAYEEDPGRKSIGEAEAVSQLKTAEAEGEHGKEQESLLNRLFAVSEAETGEWAAAENTAAEPQDALNVPEEEASGDVNALPEAALAEDAPGISIRSYLTGGRAKAAVKGGWELATEFGDGDLARITLYYTLPEGVIRGGVAPGRTVRYQLPEGMSILEEERGSVSYDGELAGQYLITESGSILIRFEDSFAGGGKSVNGAILFTARLSYLEEAQEEIAAQTEEAAASPGAESVPASETEAVAAASEEAESSGIAETAASEETASEKAVSEEAVSGETASLEAASEEADYKEAASKAAAEAESGTAASSEEESASESRGTEEESALSAENGAEGTGEAKEEAPPETADAFYEIRLGGSAGSLRVYPAETLTAYSFAKNGQVRATAHFRRGTFPAGTSMKLRALEEDGEEAAAYRSRTAEYVEKQGESLVAAYFYDITFLDREGRELEPAGESPVSISMFFTDTIGETHAAESGWELLHFKKSGELEPLTDGEETSVSVENGSRLKRAEFVQTSFSVTGIAQTSRSGGGEQSLNDYVNSVTVYKKNGGTYIPANGTLQNGDEVRISLLYQITENVLTSRTIRYTVPAGVALPDTQLTGSISTSAGVVGIYVVDPSGYITLTFDEDYEIKKGFTGYVQIDGTIKVENSGSPTVLDFGNGQTVTVNPPSMPPAQSNTDISASKSSVYDKSTGLIRYTIEVSSQKGTDGKQVTIGDLWYNYDGKLGISRFSDFELKDLQGRPVSLPGRKDKTVGEWGSGTSEFSYEKLPALSAGEGYRLSYTVDAKDLGIQAGDGSAKVINFGRARTENLDSGWKYQETRISEPKISKSGSVNPAEEQIHWTIEFNKDGEDISYYTLTDVLETLKGEATELPDTVMLVERNLSDGSESSTVISWKDGYRFPQGSVGKSYAIRYTTKLPKTEAGVTATVKNSVELKDEQGKNSYQVSSTVSYQKPKRDYNVSKWSPTELDEGEYVQSTEGGALLTWHARIDLAEGEPELEKLTFTDIFSAKNEGGALAPELMHYSTAKLLQSMTVGTPGEAPLTLAAGTDYRLYTESGTEITGTASETKLRGFVLRFTEEGLGKVVASGAEAIMLRYQTEAKYDGAVGTKWRYLNSASIPGHSVSKEYSHTAEGKLNKEVSLDKNGNNYQNGYVSASLESLDNGYGEKTLKYRIIVTPESYGEDVRVKDILPAGLQIQANKYGENFQVNYRSGSWEPGKKIWGINANGNSVELELPYRMTAAVTEGASGSELDFVIPRQYILKGNGEFISFVIYYSVRITDEYWQDPMNYAKDYLNQASYKEHTDIERVKVTNASELVKKTALPGDDASDRVVEYHLEINPQGRDLLPGMDSITLKDTLKVEGASDGDKASKVFTVLDPRSVRLYRYDWSKEDRKGELISPEVYTVEITPEARSFSLVIPDELACVVEYSYGIQNTDPNRIRITNTAELQGMSNGGGGNTAFISSASSSAGVFQQYLKVYKVDSRNFGITLSEVRFRLEQWVKEYYDGSGNKVDGHWETVSTDVTTDGDGMLIYNPNGTGAEFRPKLRTLYRLTETGNPNEGYEHAGAEPLYFAFADVTDTDKTSVYWALGEDIKKELPQDRIQYVGANEIKTEYIANEYKIFKVEKRWLNRDGSELSEKERQGLTAEFELYSQRKGEGSRRISLELSGNGTLPGKVPKLLSVPYGFEADLIIRYNGSGSVFYGGQAYEVKYDARYGSHVRIGLGIVTKDRTVAVSGFSWLPNVSGAEYEIKGEKSYVAVGAPVYVESFTLSEDNGWVWKRGNLPRKDAEGYELSYFVKELSVPGFVSSYSENNSSGIQDGTITVQNTRTEAYVLPETGGQGSGRIYMGGGCLLFLAAFFLYIKKKQERGEQFRIADSSGL